MWPQEHSQNAVPQENCGTSLVEAFEALQIRQHIHRLRQPDMYDQGPGSRGQPMNGIPAGPPNPEDESACAVCGIIRLTFEPPAVYCTSCAQRIKRNQVCVSSHGGGGATVFLLPASCPGLYQHWRDCRA